MADRIVKVSLQAQVSNYVAGMEQARKATENAGKTAADVKARFEAQNQAMTQIGTGLLAVGTLAAVGVGLAIKSYADFDEAMSSVQASTHESAENMALLRDAAIEAGASTVFTAKEAANAIDELAKAGIQTSDILGGALAGSLDLASAGGLGVADAASIAATALTQFKLEGRDVPHVADLLAAGAGKAQGSVQDLAAALNQGGLVASQAGFSIEETTGTLAAFASAGLLGSDAGTSLKTAILALQAPSKTAQAAMDEYGISVYDSNGKMKSFAEIADVLQKSLGDQSDEARNAALSTIFGTDAVRSAAVLYDQGAKGIEEWNEKVNDSGYAAETARIKLDNLNGDIEKLGGSFDTALIKAGSAADGTLRVLVQTATEAVDVFNSAPPIVQQAALVLGVVTAAVALTGGTFLVAVPKIAAFQLALNTLQESTMPGVASGALKLEGAMTKTGSAIGKAAGFLTGPWGLALAAAAIGTKILIDYLDSLKASTEEYQNVIANADGVDELFKVADQGRILSFLGEATNSAHSFQSALDELTNNPFATGLNLSTQQLKKSLADLGKELASTAASDLPTAQKSFRLLADSMELSKSEQVDLLDAMPEFKAALEAQANALGINITSTDDAANNTALLELAFGNATPNAYEAADAYLAAGNEADELRKQVDALVESMEAANGAGQNAVTSNNDWLNALADVDDYIAQARAGVEGYALTLDTATQAGRDNMDSLVDLSQKSIEAAKAQYDLDGNTDAYRTTLENGRQAVIDRATALGATAEQAQALADKIYAIPSEKQFTILANVAAAQQAIDRFLASNANHKVTIATGLGGTGGLVAGKAAGGAVEGPGTGTSDTAGLYALSNGEHVWTTAEVSAAGGQAAMYQMRAAVLAGRGRAAGGEVGYASQLQYAPQGANYSGYAQQTGHSGPAPIYRVTETVNLVVEGKVLATTVRTYDRSTK